MTLYKNILIICLLVKYVSIYIHF